MAKEKAAKATSVEVQASTKDSRGIETIFRSATPIGNRALIEKDLPEESVGAIVVPDTAKTPTDFATVLTVGPDCKQLKPGQRIIASLRVRPVQPGNPRLCVVFESDVFAILPDAKKEK